MRSRNRRTASTATARPPATRSRSHDADGNELGSTTVAEDGSWYIDVDRDEADDVSFYVNGEHAEAEITSIGPVSHRSC